MASVATGERRRVVVVDGGRARGQALSHGLRAHGHDATPIRHGGTAVEAAVAAAIEDTTCPVLLVTGDADDDLLSGLANLRRRHPDLRVLVLDGDPATARPARREPDGLDCETVPVQIGIRRLAEVIAERRPAPRAPSRQAPRPVERAPEAELVDELTDREREVLRTLMAGLGREEIADRLSVSRHTVRTHLHNVFTKLGAHSQLEAVGVGLRAGLRPAEPAPTAPEGDVA